MIDASINGVTIWMAHHGPASGRNERSRGDALRNRLKDIMDQCLAKKKDPPRVVVFADKHVKAHVEYERGDYKIDGFLLPSWKLKDGFVYKVDPFAWSNIGSLIMVIPENGNLQGGPCKRGFWEWQTVDITQDERVTI